jgi:hypothetical protein
MYNNVLKFNVVINLPDNVSLECNAVASRSDEVLGSIMCLFPEATSVTVTHVFEKEASAS